VGAQYSSRAGSRRGGDRDGCFRLETLLHSVRSAEHSTDCYAWLFRRMCGLSTQPDVVPNPFFADTFFCVLDFVRTHCAKLMVCVRVLS
jgi:hypothetical protein